MNEATGTVAAVSPVAKATCSYVNSTVQLDQSNLFCKSILFGKPFFQKDIVGRILRRLDIVVFAESTIRLAFANVVGRTDITELARPGTKVCVHIEAAWIIHAPV
jgi:hypothetical protein